MGAANFIIFLAALALLSPSKCDAHNITRVLQRHRNFSLFNRYITETKIADDINTRSDVTVLAVENAAMAVFLKKNLGLDTVKNILSLHVLLEYFDSEKLKSIRNGSTVATTLFQTSGIADAGEGFLNITDLKKGQIGFTSSSEVNGSKPQAIYVSSLLRKPYNFSVVQISNPILPERLAVKSKPPDVRNITDVLVGTGHGIFADLLNRTGAMKSYVDAYRNGGLTVFAPVDGAFDGVLKKVQALPRPQQVALLEFHALPFYSPRGTLRATKGKIATLATNGTRNYTLRVERKKDNVRLRNGRASVAVSQAIEDQLPLAIFSVDKLLDLPEILIPGPSPSPLPSPPETSPPQAPISGFGPTGESPDSNDNSSAGGRKKFLAASLVGFVLLLTALV